MYNKVTMIGWLTADPELRKTSNGISVASFRISVSRKYVRKGEKRRSDYFNVVCWRQIAEFVKANFTKGKTILVEGEMQTRQCTDVDGDPTTCYGIIAERVSFTAEKMSEALPEEDACHG